MNTNDGGPAFPRPATDNLLDGDGSCGMSLRDWFAGQALAGILANPSLVVTKVAIKEAREKGEQTTEETYTRWAVQYADAMLAARQNGGDA